jgi:putative colanic acid biosynthesis glycosyltransferase
MTASKPFFSIVTVCFRDNERLKQTIASVQRQECKDFEYLIIDGGSVDGTAETVAAVGSLITKFISEKDRGIYDAMNKGLNLATGAYILFLNAGDLLADEKALQRTSEALGGRENLLGIICPVKTRYPGFTEDRVNRIHASGGLWRGLPTSHQGIVYNLDILKRFPFDLTYKLAADFDQYLRVTTSSEGAFLVGQTPLAIVEAGGVSDLNRNLSRQEYMIACKRHLAGSSRYLAIALQLVMTAYDKVAAILKRWMPAWFIHTVRLRK